MPRRRLAILFGCALVLATSTLAHAQPMPVRTWVSGAGDDSGPCSRITPCKTFAGAIVKTAIKGEINVLDTASYGVVTIRQPIAIIAEGVTAGVVASAMTAGITINIPGAAPSDTVILRGLDINGMGTGPTGVRILSAGTVYIDNSFIHGFGLYGIQADQPTSNSRVFVSNTSVHNVNSGLVVGLAVNATVDSFRSEHNRYGIQAYGDAKVHVRNSVLSSNVIGVLASGNAQATIRGTTIGYNTETGVKADGAGAIARLAATTVTANTTGLRALAGGRIISTGNNYLRGNGTDGAPTSTPGGM